MNWLAVILGGACGLPVGFIVGDLLFGAVRSHRWEDV
jgi:hypothetical protein